MSEQQDTVWLTVAQVAERLHTTARTVSKMIRVGTLPAVRLSKREGVRIRRADLDTMPATRVGSNQHETEE